MKNNSPLLDDFFESLNILFFADVWIPPNGDYSIHSVRLRQTDWAEK